MYGLPECIRGMASLENGGYGVDQIDTIAQYQAALDEAGYQDVLAAFQAQYDGRERKW